MSSNNQSGGVGVLTVIFIILLILKLTNVVNISWFWVFSPLILGFVLFIVSLIVIFGFIKALK